MISSAHQHSETFQTQSEQMQYITEQFHQMIHDHPELAGDALEELKEVDQWKSNELHEAFGYIKGIERDIQCGVAGYCSTHPDVCVPSYDENHKHHHANPYSSQQSQPGHIA